MVVTPHNHDVPWNTLHPCVVGIFISDAWIVSTSVLTNWGDITGACKTPNTQVKTLLLLNLVHSRVVFAMSLFCGKGLPTLHTQSPSAAAASHHTETCNVVIFGETGAGKSSLVNLVAGTQAALTSCDAMGCTIETNVYDVSIQNETLKVKLFDTVGLGEGPEGKVPDKDARRMLKKLLRDLMTQTDIHLLSVLCAGLKERVPIVLVATGLEDKAPEMEEWWRNNERYISDFGMTFAGHACVTTMTIDKYAEDKLKRRH
ncbi:hypothetical protein BD769DRAFT_1662991 [Suillus cothurnatus]|nr:hypothetical protein BD769DRAFT_1662991 [Suillus cothurnatus]